MSECVLCVTDQQVGECVVCVTDQQVSECVVCVTDQQVRVLCSVCRTQQVDEYVTCVAGKAHVVRQLGAKKTCI